MKARPAAGGGRWVEISPERMRGWLDGFYGRHDGATERGLVLTGASNGDIATLHPPPGIVEVADVNALLTALRRPPRIGLLLARKGAVAVGVVDGTTVTISKVQRAYVQGRTAAGGTSQQRFARRRANQADAATGRAAEIAARILLPHVPDARNGPAADCTEPGSDATINAEPGSDATISAEPGSDATISALVCGGDRLMIDAVLADRRLRPLAPLRHPHLLDVAEPRLAVLQDAAVAARRVRIHLVP